MSELQALLERVKAAEGADWKIDEAIYWHFSEWRNLGGYWVENKITGERKRSHNFAAATKFTASIDAALALVERVLPGWHGALTWMPENRVNDALHCCEIGPMTWGGDEPPDNIIGSAATAPLAILAALLSALIAKESAALAKAAGE